MTVITLTSGTAFIMWLGEQITERGIGNGISLIIFAGIVARMPTAIGNTFRLISTGEMGIFSVLVIVVLMVGVIGFIVFVEQGQRRIPVQYAKRVVGRKMRRWQQTLASADGQEFQRLKRYLRVLFKAPAGMSELEQLRRTGVQSGDV